MTDPGVALIIVWVTFAVLMLAAIVAVLVWAVRSRQFADQDRARYLPLESGIPEEQGGTGDKPVDGKDASDVSA
jgi:cbb3-type cytochrome oxidase maturation protein